MQIKNYVFDNIVADRDIDNQATFTGVTIKSFILLGIALASALFAVSNLGLVLNNPFTLIIVSVIGMVCLMVGRINANAAMICGIVYSICEGMFVGILSTMAEVFVPGITSIAITTTFGIFAIMLILYSIKAIAATDKLRKFMFALSLGMVLFSVVTVVMGLFNPGYFDLFFGQGWLSIIVAAVMLVFCSFMLVLEFDQVQRYVRGGFDKKYEWAAGLGLIYTVLAIYIQVVRVLLIIFANRD